MVASWVIGRTGVVPRDPKGKKLGGYERDRYQGIFKLIAEEWGMEKFSLRPDIKRRNRDPAKYDPNKDPAYRTKQGVNYRTCWTAQYASVWLLDDQALAYKERQAGGMYYLAVAVWES